MRAPTGSIDITCDVRGERSLLKSLRSSGLSRTSRAFAERDGAVRVVLGTLGPGLLAGDRFEVTGRALPQSALVVRGQMATPVFPGGAPSHYSARWTVGDGGVLDAVNEPLVLEAGSEHVSRTCVEIEGDGVAIVAETIAFRGAAKLSTRTVVSLDGRPVLRDALAFSSDRSSNGALGTIVFVAREAALRAAVAARARTICAPLAGQRRAGCGETGAAVVIRLDGCPVWTAQRLTHDIAEAARRLIRPHAETVVAAAC